MKYIVILSTLFLAGCISVPVDRVFPGAPGKEVTVPCPELKKLNDDAKLSDVARITTENFTTYYECAIKVDAWNEWYTEQKKIFEKVGK